MRAMILAAGRGERMGALTQLTPKPLLEVAGRYLIEYAILNLKRAGILNMVINVSYHGEQIKQALGYGQRYGVNIMYSEELERLETGGGIVNALPLLGKEPFVVVSSDVVTDYPIEQLKKLKMKGSAHLVLVANPTYHPEGDFGLTNKKINFVAKKKLTYANIGLYDPQIFSKCKSGYFKLVDVLTPAVRAGEITGEEYPGLWYNVGTPQDLVAASELVTSGSGLIIE